MLDNEFKWIRRESRLLKAFVKDVVELLHLEVQIDSERSQRQLWDSHSNVEITELQQNFETWKEETDNVVFGANIIVEFFLKYRRHFSTMCALVIKYREMKRIKNLINKRLELMQIFPKNIYGLLERSRSKLRGLRGKPIDERKSASPRPPVFKGVALVSSLSEKVNNMITQNQDLITGMDSQIQFVNLQLLLLHAFLKDLEEVGSETAIEKAWIDDVADFINDVDHAIHAFAQRTDYANRLPPDVYSWIQNLMLRKDIEWINAGFSGLYQGKDTYGFKFIRRRQQSLQSQNNPIDDTISAVNKIQRHLNQEQDILIDVYLEVKALLNQLKDLCKLFEDPKATEVYHIELRQKSRSSIGFEEDTHELVSRLTNNEDISVDSIVGMQGIGKTTLAKIVYNHKAIVNHFPFRAWVSVPQESNDVNTLLEDVGNQVLKISELQEEPDGKDFWINKMNKFLKENKFLLVLENILTKEAWDTLKEAFPKTTNGSKILLTTHSRTVASHANQDNTPFQLRLRTKEESWLLFIQRAQFPPDNLSPSHTEAIKEVVERCGGLPQAIEYLVDKFSGKDVTALDLRRVPINDHFQNGWSKTLENEDLSEDLKKCFSYFRLFPSNFEIPTRRLIALWVAQGLVKQSDVEKETLEDVAEKYLSELIGLNMIQVVQKKINGKVKTCRLPNALLELCLSKCVSSNRQLADHFNKNDTSFAHIHGNNTTSADLQCYKRHVSFLSFDTREGTKPGEDIENFLRKAISSGCFKVLKVLDLERVFRPQLPNAIGNLIELKYLGLRWTYLEMIPSSIGNLRKLQTLDVKHTYLHTLPSSIWKLKELRHLYLTQIYQSKFAHQPSSSSLKNLQTLWGVFVGEDSHLKDGLEKWTNLRKLGLALQLPSQQQRALAKCVVKLNNLECLSLRSIDEMSKPQVLYLESLSGMKNLTSLYLFGKLEIPSIISEFPQSLSDLTLSASGLKNDPLPALDKLPNLKSLCFYSGSYERREMVCSRGRFTKLLVLKLWKLEMLEELQVEEGAMQNLRELDIRSCKELKFPTGLKHLKNLRELNSWGMPEEFTTRIEGIRGKFGMSLPISYDY
ncbi:putative inactive disease susceptibility protein LOV1 [Quercus suber]|uniref:putative inactive disease susceptibility protein LOV1 n=1 Tax=Quercus suber TaxID=58331 RepID=UPI0032DF648D